MPRRTAPGYNATMHRTRRLATLLATAWLLALVAAPAALADDPPRDPRCADWEQNGAPAGIDMRLVCAANEVIGAYTGQSSTDELNREPLTAYITALVVMGTVFAVVGIVATRYVGGKAGRRLAPERPDSWWVCPACQSLNAEGRTACYRCQASRAEAAAVAGEAPMVVRRAE